MTQKQKLALAAICAVVLFASCSDSFPSISANAPPREFFGATLVGSEEVPAVTTTASGTSDVTVLDTNLIRVEVRVTTIDSVTQSHIHAGTTGVNGPIMVFLFGLATPAPTITGTNVVLRQLDINRATVFQTGWTFDSLMFRIKNNLAYVNVHTRRNGGGEIRGQIVPK